MPLNVCKCDSVTWVFLQESLEKILKFGGKVGRNDWLVVEDGLEHDANAVGMEWKACANHGVEEHAKAPDVSGCCVRFFFDDFGCDVGWGTAGCFEEWIARVE